MRNFRPPRRAYKLYDIINSLQPSEIRKLRKFLKSPYFLMRSDVVKLFDLLTKLKAKGKSMPPLEYAFEKVFPKERYDAVKMRGAMSDLMELIEEYLVISHRAENKLRSRLMLSRIFRQRRLNKCFQSNLKKTEQLLEEFPKRTEGYYQNVLDFQLENMKFAIPNRRTSHLYFQEISETNDVLYLIRKLKTACSQLTHQSVYKTDYDNGLLKYFINEIENEHYLDIPAIAIFYYCFKFLSEENSLGYFQKFKKELTEHKDHFTNDDLKGHYRLGVNYCIRKLNEGDENYAKEGWELYKKGLEEEVILENNQLTRFTFNNMVAMALRLKEFEWVEQFIQAKKHLLKEDFRHQTEMFNFARLEFDRGEFGQALLHLQEAEYKDLVNSLIAKMLQIKIYFELKEFETLESVLDSFAQFIRRREVSDFHRNIFLNNIRFIRKIRSTPSYNKSALAQIRQNILVEKDLSERVWLLEKVGG